MANPIFIDADPAGMVATHPERITLPVLAAPIPAEQKDKNFNTFRPHLVAIGCMRLPNKGFAFDSSLVAPDAESAFTRLAKLMQRLRDADDANPKRFPPCSVFGHADPTGKPEYNKTLSGRRALAVYAVLTRNTEMWEELFQNGFGGDEWGIASIQTMLSVPLRKPPKETLEPPYYTGPIDGAKTPETKTLIQDAVSAYRMARGLGSTKEIRRKLFEEYMDGLCHDQSGERLVLDPATDFIARRKGGNELKGDVQGCGEFNPIFLLSKEMEKESLRSKEFIESRNEIYKVDRRVIVYLFRQGTEIDQNRWPCPAAREGSAGCRLRFWSDFEKRLSESNKNRTFGEEMSILTLDGSNQVTVKPVEQTGNTMACRFYHGFAVNSPCEAKQKEWVIRFLVDSFKGQRPLRYRRFVFTAGESGSAAVIRGITDANGVLRIPVFDEKVTMTLLLDAARVTGPDVVPKDDPNNPPDESKYVKLTFDGGALHPRDTSDELAVKQRLYNLGFGDDAPETWSAEVFAIAMRHFRRQTANKPDPRTDEEVLTSVMNEHDLMNVPAPAED